MFKCPLQFPTHGIESKVMTRSFFQNTIFSLSIQKNRKAIPCYWESQPGGCLKPHCPFLHQNAKPATADESHENKTDSGTG
jgi:hypothetical protein